MGISARPFPTVAVRTGVERATLVRRTYLLVFASVLVTIAGAAFGQTQPALMQSVMEHPFITMICMFAPLIARDEVPRRLPGQHRARLPLHVRGRAGDLADHVLLRTDQPRVVGQAGMLTGSAFGVLTLYAFLSRRDFSAMGAFFTVGLWVLIATSLLNLFFQNQTASLWISGATVLVFSGLLVFDTWRLRNVYGPDDYVQAAVTIYLDLLNMFLAILNLLGGRRN